MAIPILAPAITKTRQTVQAIAQSSQRAILRLVPELENGRSITNRSFTILVTILMVFVLMVMFVISSLSTRDAFTLAKLQREAQVLSDQREAIAKEVARRSSPDVLANAATKLGMRPNSEPRFIDISDVANG